MFKSLNIRTIIQALSILQKELHEENYMALIKHIFFSDRYHIRHFGFLYTYDNYCAMKLGPVPSATKDILTKSSFFEAQVSAEDLEYINKTIIPKSRYDILVSENSETNLSDSIKESLAFTIKTFGQFNQYQLADITHDYPEWKVFEKYFQYNQAGSKQMDVSLFFDDPDPKNQPFIDKHLKGIDPYKDNKDFLKALKEDYLTLGIDC